MCDTNALKPVILTAKQDEYPVGLHLEILEDLDKTWTIADVSAPELSYQFVLSQAETTAMVNTPG